MNGLTLRHLRYLVAVADHGQFSRAAAVCSISQPALSQQIKELETLIGERIFERSARQVVLTPLGEEALERARAILASVQDFGDFVKAAQETVSGTLRLGIIPTIAPYLLPRILGALSDAYPDLTVRPREAITTQLISDLSNHRLDLALVALPVGEDGLHEESLFDEEFVLVRSAADAGKPVPAPHNLSKMELLLLEEGHCFREQAISFCGLAGPRAERFMEASSLSTLVQMVSAGVGITVIPEMALALETRSQDVSFCRFDRPAPSRQVGLIWRRTSPLARTFTAISGTIRGCHSAPSETNKSAPA